jgi:hypothetical protein
MYRHATIAAAVFGIIRRAVVAAVVLALAIYAVRAAYPRSQVV